jgi:hypothetical protein
MISPIPNSFVRGHRLSAGTMNALARGVREALAKGEEAVLKLKPGFPAIITSSDEIETGKFEYELAEAVKIDAGYGQWSEMEGGRSGRGYHFAEEVTGSDSAIADGEIVFVQEMRFVAGDLIEFWFTRGGGGGGGSLPVGEYVGMVLTVTGSVAYAFTQLHSVP